MGLQGKESRFLARWFSQVEGVHYYETFAPVARYSSIISILALSAQMGWKIHQMDIKTIFLNDMIEEEVYIEQPEGFETFNRNKHPVLGTLGSIDTSPGDDKLIKSCKEDLAREFEMKDLGLMNYPTSLTQPLIGFEYRLNHTSIALSFG
eukprot:PITA_21137